MWSTWNSSWCYHIIWSEGNALCASHQLAPPFCPEIPFKADLERLKNFAKSDSSWQKQWKESSSLGNSWESVQQDHRACLSGIPLESCGILAGMHGRITKFYPWRIRKELFLLSYGTRRTAKSFPGDGKEGLELSAIYHSHPHTAAFPSQRMWIMLFTRLPYFDNSLIEKELPKLGFSIEKGKIERKAVRVT